MTSTFRQKFLKKFKVDDQGYNLNELSKISNIKKSILQEVYNRGIGAYKSNLSSVRLKKDFSKNPNIKKFPASKRLSKEQWAFARVYGFIMKNPKQVLKNKPDYDLFLKTKKKK
jgi:hypothetical protein